MRRETLCVSLLLCIAPILSHIDEIMHFESSESDNRAFHCTITCNVTVETRSIGEIVILLLPTPLALMAI